MNVKKMTIATGLIVAMTLARSVSASEVNLIDLAVKDGSGNLVVLWDEHESGWWAGDQYTPFDGATDVYIDPKRVSTPTWVGYELNTPQVITRIRFFGRRSGDGAQRLCYCRVEGANQADFSDAVTLLETKDVVPTDWRTSTTGWFDEPARSFTTPQTFKYIRFIQPKPTGISGETTTYCGNVTEVEFYGMDAESYASYAPTVAKEKNLRLYALHDSTGALDILSDKTEPYGEGYEYDKVFDGNISTFYDPKTKSGISHYVGYALAKPVCVTRMRYSGRQTGSGAASRLRACRIEGANQLDFSDAVTLHVCANSVPDNYDSIRGWIEVVPDATAGINTFKYLRFIDPVGNQQCGDISELEFYGMDADVLVAQILADPQPPTGIVATHGDYPEVPVVLRWQLQLGVSDSTVLRAPGVNGPWTELARLSGANSYTDTTAPVGILSYYRVAANFSHDGQNFSVTNETPVAFRRWRLLERDPSDMTHFRSGASLIFNCSCGCWTPTTAYNWPAVTNSLMIAFNNVLYKYSGVNSEAGFAYSYDFADTASASPRTCIGADLGEPAHVAYLRFFSSINENNKARLNGVVLSGSNSEDWKQPENSTVLTEPLAWTAQAIWYEKPSLDTANTYRYLFCHNPDKNDWNNNASELQFYGWLESDVAVAAQGVSDFAVVCGTMPSVTLTWTPVSYGTYTIARKTDGGEWQTVASALPASTATWTDSAVTMGTLYAYRVTTINGANEAYSADCEIRPYLAGNGIGLHGVWSAGYTSTNAGESVASVTTNAVIDFANVSVGGATENFFVRWTGKLITPFAGDYVFDAEADDTVTLWIDGKPVLYRQSLDGTAQTAPGGALTLTAGEHDIVMTWFQSGGDNLCRLYWSGPVARAIIPSSQLVPVPAALPEDWAGARTFNGVPSANNPGDVRFNADGSIDLAYGGNDLYLSENGYNFLWKPMTGDFTCVARVAFIGQKFYITLAQKGGLMVRSALDAAAPFEACVIKMDGGHMKIGGKRCVARGNNPVDGGKYLDGASCWTERVSDDDTGCWLRMCREGNTITYSYRKDNGGGWKTVYSFGLSPDVYGETVYVGLTSTSYIGAEYSRTPTYDWRFTNAKVRPISGTVFTIR